MSFAVEIMCLMQQALFDLRVAKPDIDQCIYDVGIKDPVKYNRLQSADHFELLKLGPRRLLIRASLDMEQQVEKSLVECLALRTEVSLVNVSDLYQGLQLEGRQARELLAHVAPLDLDRFPVGAGTGTQVFSIAGIIIHEAVARYSIYVDRSYFNYVQSRMSNLTAVSVSTTRQE